MVLTGVRRPNFEELSLSVFLDHEAADLRVPPVPARHLTGYVLGAMIPNSALWGASYPRQGSQLPPTRGT